MALPPVRDIRPVEIVALEEQGHPMILRHRIREAVAQIELGRMPAPLPISVPVISRKSPTSFLASATLTSRLRQIASVASNTAIGEVMQPCLPSSRSVSASASASPVRMATMAEASTNISCGR
jgi:hypothetical protein